MAAFALVAGVTGGAAAMSLLAGRARWGWAWALIWAAVGVGALIMLSPPQLSPLGIAGELSAGRLALLFGWYLYGALSREAAGRIPRRHLGAFALLGGALLGDLAAAAVIAGAVQDKRLAARAALVASAAGLLTGVGTAATLLVASPGALIAPAALAIAVAWPRGAEAGAVSGGDGEDGPWLRPLAPLALIGLLSLWQAPLALALGIVFVGWRTRLAGLKHLDWRPLVLLAAVTVAAWAAWRSGALWSAEWGIAWLASRAPGLAEPLLLLVGALIAALGGEPAAALVGAEILQAPLYPRFPELAGPLAAGLGLGGLGPLLISGGWRAGWRIWLGQLTAAVLWAAAWGALR